MRSIVALGALLLAVGSYQANADEGNSVDPRPCPDCKPETKEVCFNLVCNYEFENHGPGIEDYGPRHCTVASVFTKAVTLEGGEVSDHSEGKSNPTLQVTCDNEVVYNDSSRRFTDLLGTRIQGQQGPTPAILLPRGALHSGGHYSSSTIELDLGHGFIRARGKCQVWTGFPLH